MADSIVLFLVFVGRHMADGREQPAVVEPVDPDQRRVPDVVDATPRLTAAVTSVLQRPLMVSASAVVRVADATDRLLDASRSEPLGVANQTRASSTSSAPGACARGMAAHRITARIAANIISLLDAQLAGKPCAVFSSDLRIGVPATELVTYPDVSIVCGSLERDPIDRTGHTVVNPKVLLEVLSPSTADYDRGEKLVHYKHLPSLEAFVLFDHAAQRPELWQRAETEWQRSEHTDHVTIAAIGCTLVIADVYRDQLRTP